MDGREVERYLHKLYAEGDQFEVAYIQPSDDRGGRVARVTRTYVETDMGEVLAEMERAEDSGLRQFNASMKSFPTWSYSTCKCRDSTDTWPAV